MMTSALIMSLGALSVALIDSRVPVFEIVVRDTGVFCNPISYHVDVTFNIDYDSVRMLSDQ